MSYLSSLHNTRMNVFSKNILSIFTEKLFRLPLQIPYGNNILPISCLLKATRNWVVYLVCFFPRMMPSFIYTLRTIPLLVCIQTDRLIVAIVRSYFNLNDLYLQCCKLSEMHKIILLYT